MANGRLHLVGLGGSNKVMAGEFSRLIRRAFPQEKSRTILAREPEKVGPGGLWYPFDEEAARIAVYYHRTSARVLWSLFASSATHLEPLFDDLVEQISGERGLWMNEGLRFSVQALGTRSIEAGERQVVGVVKNALIEGAARLGVKLQLDPEDPQVVFQARTVETRQGVLLSVGIDLAGRPMHQRGYRLVSGEAPLREDLAAQVLMLSRYNAQRDLLIDPMAGSGTLAIEAALMAAGRSIWMSGRSPLARNMAPFDGSWGTKAAPLFGDATPPVFAAEIDDQTYGAMDRAIATAGTSQQTTTFLGDFRDWDLKPLVEKARGERSVLIVSNPPYGGRLGLPRHELRALYRDLAQFCSAFEGARAAFLIGDPDSGVGRDGERGNNSISLFLDAFPRPPRIKKPMKNGALNALFVMYDL